MDLKILMGILIYWTFISLLYFGLLQSVPGYTINTNLSLGSVDVNETINTGVIGQYIDWQRFILFTSTGFGIPGTVPVWFQIIFSAWTIIFNIFSLGWLINSIWSG